MIGKIVAVARKGTHAFSKDVVPSIHLLEGLGVEGDAHMGVTVKHRSRVAVDPSQPNLRQVHLLHTELFDDLARAGFDIAPADLGENVSTRGVNLLGLSRGTRLHLGDGPIVEVTGLRNPCAQIEAFRPGLLAQVLEKTADGRLIRKSGIMGIVLRGGAIKPGDAIRVEAPPGPHVPLERV